MHTFILIEVVLHVQELNKPVESLFEGDSGDIFTKAHLERLHVHLYNFEGLLLHKLEHADLLDSRLFEGVWRLVLLQVSKWINVLEEVDFLSWLNLLGNFDVFNFFL